MKPLLVAALLLAQGTPVPRIGRGVIEGTVRALDGSPAAGVRVAALAAPDAGAKPDTGSAVLASQAQTDNSGRYRMEDVPAGRYYVTAGLLDLPTYYPGVRSITEAQVLTVGAGALLGSVDFTLSRSAGAVRVSGRVSGLPAGTPAGLVQVVLTPTQGVRGARGPGGSAANGTAELQQAPVQFDGSFEFDKVPPGAYQAALRPARSSAATVPVQVENDDVRGMTLSIGPALLGRVVVDDGSKLPLQASSVVGGATDPLSAVGFAVRRMTPAATSAADVRSDGFFILPGAPGEYEAAVTMLPFGYYLKSMSQGRSDLMNEPVRVHAVPAIGESAQLLVTLTRTPPPGAAPGFKISGRSTGNGARGLAGPRWVSIQGSAVSPNPLLGLQTTLVGEAPLREDGTFEVPHVPKGEFTVRVLPAPSATLRVNVTDRDVSGIEVSTGGFAPARGAPALPSLSFDALPLLPRSDVRVSGQVKGIPPGAAQTLRWITLFTGPSSPQFLAPIHGDGAFEFTRIPPGTYSVRLDGRAAILINETVTVRDKDLIAIELPYPR
jgi:hypothetical protein